MVGGQNFSEVICWSLPWHQNGCSFRHKLFFFCLFHELIPFFVLFTYTQSERLRRFFHRWVQVIYYWVQNQQGSAQYKDRESANLPLPGQLWLLCNVSPCVHMKTNKQKAEMRKKNMSQDLNIKLATMRLNNSTFISQKFDKNQ